MSKRKAKKVLSHAGRRQYRASTLIKAAMALGLVNDASASKRDFANMATLSWWCSTDRGRRGRSLWWFRKVDASTGEEWFWMPLTGFACRWGEGMNFVDEHWAFVCGNYTARPVLTDSDHRYRYPLSRWRDAINQWRRHAQA